MYKDADMARERIVVETTDVRKAALAEQLDISGESFSSWIENQIDDAVPLAAHLAAAPPNEPKSIDDLLDSAAVLKRLESLDWAFTDEDTRYLTHDLHPYPAKFPPQIPAKAISALSLPGDVVMDPFGGSGTTAVEAVRLGRRAISVDANPLSAMVGRVKTLALREEALASLAELQTAVDGYRSNGHGKSRSWSESLIAKHSTHIPDIPNLHKWFCIAALGELALLRHLIGEITQAEARDVALAALSRIVTRVSNQDSETRYVAHDKELAPTFVLKAYQESLKLIVKRLEAGRASLLGTQATFLEGDSRSVLDTSVAEGSVDLIVTSPPYPNATDYHLYHRFRLFWLGHDPRSFGALEIGSHLKHQRKGTDFAEYRDDMSKVLKGCFRALQPGRFAVLVVGDAVFKGETFSTATELAEAGRTLGFEVAGIIDRPIHQTKRSFSAAARRARSEQLLILRKPNEPAKIVFEPPAYKMWPYESDLRVAELRALGLPVGPESAAKTLVSSAAQPALWNARRAAFSKTYRIGGGQASPQETWQSVLENGDSDPTTRKDPKYATHGLHAYKGKFYPQLAKSLLNAGGCSIGSVVFDPYCGSGTVPLEGFLNGYKSYGVDMNPLAAKIAHAKTGVLQLDRELVRGAMSSLMIATEKQRVFPTARDHFSEANLVELESWFPSPVLDKLNWLLGHIRLFGEPTLVDFLEVVVSSIIRDISQQEPSDLRIRRRKEPLEDAPVMELFRSSLSLQARRLEKYWRVKARAPGRQFAPVVREGDSRDEACLREMGLVDDSVDCVVTSPPYATALPYIDTDRLSILAVMGVPTSERSVIEARLTGSREIKRSDKVRLEQILHSESAEAQLPAEMIKALRYISEGNSVAGVGFRRDNMPALLWRYFIDIQNTLKQVKRVLKVGARAYYVVGDSRTKVGETWTQIATCDHVSAVAAHIGLKVLTPIEIDVTTERMLHLKNAITKNEVLIFEKV